VVLVLPLKREILMKKTFFAALLAPLFLAACITPVAYVDPKYDSAAVIVPQSAGLTTDLEVEFFRNGKPAKSVDKTLRKSVEKALAIRGWQVAESGGLLKMKFEIDNRADLGEAAADGFGTGLTLGLAGSTVSDFYQAKVSITGKESTFEKTYDHAIHTTIGRVKEPPIANVAPAGNLQGAFDMLIGDIVDQAIVDFLAASLPAPPSVKAEPVVEAATSS
jgi:hypothetical protein